MRKPEKYLRNKHTSIMPKGLPRKDSGNPKDSKGGRPPAIVSQDVFEKLCSIHTPQKEIMSIVRCTKETLMRYLKTWYGEELETNGIEFTYENVKHLFESQGNASLRQAQFDNAVNKNNPIMQIWLGKQVLGQAEAPGQFSNPDNAECEYDIRTKLYARVAEDLYKTEQ